MAGELQKVMVAAFIAMLSLTAGHCGSLTGEVELPAGLPEGDPKGVL